MAITTQIDEHNGFARYGWTIVDADGAKVLEGIDVVEAADDGRLRRIVMFFGALETPKVSVQKVPPDGT